MLIVLRDLKPPLILSIVLTASCLSTPELPESEPALNATAQASTTDTVSAEQDVMVPPELLVPGYHDPETAITTGGHCNVRLAECDPYPIGKGKHRRADAFCSSMCSDTIAHCEDYKPDELEWCCVHPDTNYRDSSGKEYPNKHCMPSGEPNWHTRCAPGLNP